MAKIGLDRHTLLVAAAELADESGLDSLTLAALAQKLNVRSPSLYNHVKGLPDLRAALTVYCLHLLVETTRDAVIGKSGDEAILSLCEAYLRFARSRPGLYEAFYKVNLLQHEELDQAKQELLDLFLRIMEPFGLGEQETLHAIRGLRSLLHGFATLEQHGGFQMDIPLDESFRYVLRMFVDGMNSENRR
ncbi:TetR/AcrR family transcriptional regulator [Paenibacillus azoreducens]|jgi:AcrR family transcriptional regulator|uniref:TetR family transcriptional regulator n=1 Tax=Paenibacillus azoreducens TaxID=116718 RepID=A0A919YH64_9BACL|nr:TetR/AcrR family transcriptional regulator [Paenibacillus azoreducens]GIO51122.1 TetR family transcriptional regulator [Paenibacillus azoreducens]